MNDEQLVRALKSIGQKYFATYYGRFRSDRPDSFTARLSLKGVSPGSLGLN